MESTIDIVYHFSFGNLTSKQFRVELDPLTLRLPSREIPDPPAWTRLDSNRCGCCRLDAGTHRYCPVALNLLEIVEEFQDSPSFEKVMVKVTTRERSFQKYTPIQEGLSSLIGIVMVASGCPSMEKLKPMVKFHLPFATLEETVFRMTSTYLVAQLLGQREGRIPDWKLQGLERIYGEVGEVNRDFFARLRHAATRDANVSALVNLDCFASMVPLTFEEMLEGIKDHFAAYRG